MKKYIGLFIILICLFSTAFYEALALNQGDGKGKNKNSQTEFLSKVGDLDPSSSILDINNITSWITKDGFMPNLVGNSWNGSFPKGKAAGVIYQEGIVWGGKVDDGANPLIRVSGNTYISGTTGLTSRVFRVRPDYKTGDMSDDAANFFLEASTDVTDAQRQQLRDQYAKDWNEWPANLGAPFEDRNNDGIYEPNVDVPGIPGASQTIFVTYDDRNSSDNYGSPAIGLKVNEVLWGYAIQNPLGNVIFKKVQIIYQGTSTSKSDSKIDSMYITQWSDPDDGQYSDDFAGSDSTLGMMYVYNSTTQDAIYSAIGSPPPAAGYDFLGGVAYRTGNPTDSAIVNLKWTKGYKPANVNASGNPLSTAVYFAGGGAWDDPGFDYNGTIQWYNLMRGYQPKVAQTVFPAAVTNKPEGGDGTYLLSGDPVTQTGQLDGVVEGAGDRRICAVTGPFTLALHDTAEIVSALIAGIGSNNRTSVAVMKFYDKFAQFAYDNLFQLPVYPAPIVKVTNLDGKVLLNWSNQENIDDIETPNHNGYPFQGYNVYQLPSATTDLSKAVKIATFDVVDNVTTILDDQIDPSTSVILQVPVETGKNTGIERFMTISTDALRSNVPLVNGTQYYFAVTAYGYNGDPNAPFHALESSPVPLTAVPATNNPGVRYSGVAGDTLQVVHSYTGKKSDGLVLPIVIDPTQVNGDNYKVTFDSTSGNWTLTDVTKGAAVFADQTNQSGDGNYLVQDGLQVKVVGPPLAINNWSSAGTRWVSGYDWGGAQFFGGMDLGINFFGSDVSASGYVPVEMKFTDNPTPSVANGWSQGAVYWRSDSYNYHGAGWMPFQTFDISDPANPRQVNVSFVEDANNGSANLKWDMGWDGTAFADAGGREYIFIHNTSYDPNYYNATIDGTYNDVMYAIWPQARGSHPYLEAPFTIDIVPNYPNTSSDSFTFTAPNVTSSNSLALEDVKKINVFPNPYYGFNSRETTRAGKYVTFNHLPAQATIRIFDLAGVQVRVINKNDPSQFVNWDLLNQSNLPVASGVYIVYVDMPGIGTTKIIKLAVVQEQQILNAY